MQAVTLQNLKLVKVKELNTSNIEHNTIMAIKLKSVPKIAEIRTV